MLLALQLGFVVLIAFLCMASDLTTYSGRRLF
jgi:hypothetical protein